MREFLTGSAALGPFRAGMMRHAKDTENGRSHWQSLAVPKHKLRVVV